MSDLDSPRRSPFSIGGLVLLQPLDLVIGVLVLLFFLGSAVLHGGDVGMSLAGGLLIMLVMFTVGAAIEVIIESLGDLPGLGTMVGFITNGPEALCLVVGLLAADDIVYAASTPLGSNFMNPLMLAAAGLITGALGASLGRYRLWAGLTLVTTMAVAGLFFAPWLPGLWWWAAAAAALGGVLFWLRPGDPAKDDGAGAFRRWHAVPAGALLVGAGYFLDPVVTLTATASHAPKGVIGFVVLASLTSWPEFRSCLTLLRRGRRTSAMLNITVSNITNLWLAAAGVVYYLLRHAG